MNLVAHDEIKNFWDLKGNFASHNPMQPLIMAVVAYDLPRIAWLIRKCAAPVQKAIKGPVRFCICKSWLHSFLRKQDPKPSDTKMMVEQCAETAFKA
eukprot:1141193-Pelagomonas_calceolata.AAC.9